MLKLDMIKILKANKKDCLENEWDLMNVTHYGKRIKWVEKHFRFKAVKNNQLVGTINGKYESGVVYIESIITAKESRGKGIGTELIKKAEDFGKKLGAHRTWLLTGKDWAENIFYRKLGFKLIGNMPDFYFHKDFVIYTRKII